MEQFELHLDPLDAEHIADDARRGDYYESLERDNGHLRATLDTANDQCGWARLIAAVSICGNLAQFVWAAVAK